MKKRRRKRRRRAFDFCHKTNAPPKRSEEDTRGLHLISTLVSFYETPVLSL